jgi:UDP-N-acetylglucosamine 4,6-dehydratase/UDP-glucose 4-epimerase
MIKNSLSMGTIAVTGATGYLAEKLIERLITQGHTIHAIARNEGKLIALRGKFKSVQIFPCPVEDYLLLKKALNGCDGIFHLAAFKDAILPKQTL